MSKKAKTAKNFEKMMIYPSVYVFPVIKIIDNISDQCPVKLVQRRFIFPYVYIRFIDAFIHLLQLHIV